jgi:hypothetical protein
MYSYAVTLQNTYTHMDACMAWAVSIFIPPDRRPWGDVTLFDSFHTMGTMSTPFWPLCVQSKSVHKPTCFSNLTVFVSQLCPPHPHRLVATTS